MLHFVLTMHKTLINILCDNLWRSSRVSDRQVFNAACLKENGAGDAWLVLFWQADYSCNNIRLLLVMQTASTPCSPCMVCCSLWTSVETSVPTAQASSHSSFSSSSHFLLFSRPRSSSWLPPHWHSESKLLAELANFNFCFDNNLQ